jgi:hypothetical protein
MTLAHEASERGGAGGGRTCRSEKTSLLRAPTYLGGAVSNRKTSWHQKRNKYFKIVLLLLAGKVVGAQQLFDERMNLFLI